MRSQVRTFTVSTWQQRLLLNRAVYWKINGVAAGFLHLYKKYHRVVVASTFVVISSLTLTFWLKSQVVGVSAGVVPAAENFTLTPEQQQVLSEQFDQVLSAYRPQASSEASLFVRTSEIQEFLRGYDSPLLPYADVIAAQEHWRLILAISFAESGMGKRCSHNNCSGIGVAPGHPLWREYSSPADWIRDFNRLLERRYQDKTLRQMCGVYVQPCNPNWLLATTTVMQELSVLNIP